MASKARRRTSVCLTSIVLGIATILASSEGVNGQQDGYYGKYIGKLKTLHHGVTGEVFAVDARTLHIRDFSYDGEGPAAFFYAGSSKTPSPSGFRINDEKGLTQPLQRYHNKHVTITLPDGKTLNNIKWFSVWCDEFAVNFGDVKIPKNLDYPRPQKIDPLNGVHLVSSNPIVIVDAQTLLIPNFSYDGEAPDAKFWVGRGNKPSPQGIRVPDENGKENPLRRYDHKNIVLTLPGDLTVFDIGHFGVWCEAFTVDFGHVRIPRGLNVPPSLKMLGVSPQSKLNCEVLWDDLAFEVRWAVAGDSIVMQLVGKLAHREYMSFGLSGDDFHSKMIGGDVVVAYVDSETFKGSADDYFLDDKSQCSGKRGSCPDEVFREGTNSVSPLNAAIVNGYSIVTYQRSLLPQDEFDRQVFTNRSQPVIWAIGPLNFRNQVSYHSLANKEDLFINFGRAPKWNCPIPESDASSAQQHARSPVRAPAVQQLPPADDIAATTAVSTRSRGRPQATPAPAPKIDAWEIPAIQCYEPEDGVFYAQMGPTGGKRGYPAITGHVGWGISWYINGLLIPEINVVRGKTYTFVVEGGIDPETPARYHPFYITDDPVGGYEHKTPEERANVRVFAGARQNRRGEVYPTGVGRLCNWTPDPNQPPADEFASFGAYQRTLTLECDQGEPGVVQWTPDDDTPDTVYYQCFTHRYLGWKINVLDSCDAQPEGSDPVPAHVEADLEEGDKEEDDVEGELQGRPSIQVATRVRPDFLPPGTKVEETQSYKYIPLSEFPQQPANTQQNFGNPEFPFSYEPVTSTTDTPANSAASKNEHHEEHRTSVSDTDKPQAQPLVQSAPSYQQIYNNFESSVVLHPQHHSAQEATSDDKTPISNVEPIAAEEETKYKEETYESDKQQPSQGSNLNVTVPSEPKINVQQATIRPALTLVPGKQFHPHSTTLLPLNHKRPPGGRFPVHPQMMIQRPQQYTLPHFRRPVSLPPHRGFTRPPPPGVFRPQYHNQIATAASLQHNYIINPKKPIYRPISAHHTVRPVLPHQYNRPSVVNPYSLSRVPPSGTIPLQTSPAPVRHILMSIAPSTNLSPLKLRKISTSPVTSTATATSTSTSTSTTTPLPTVIKNSAMKSSQPLSSSELVLTGAESNVGLPIAVNTGFNPHSVVVEGGFKPIISNKPSAVPVAEERSSIDEESEATGASDQYVREGGSDVSRITEESDSEEEELIKQSASEIITAIDNLESGKNPFEGQQPESFEPMFIPSPPDRNALRNGTKKVVPVGIPEDLVPPAADVDFNHRLSNNRKSGNNHPFTMIRPRPNLVRRPLYPNNLVPPFRIPARGGSPTFRYQQAGGEESAVVVDETPVAAQRMDTYYLPPSDDSTGAGVVVTYDGKTVSSESSLTAPGNLGAVVVRSSGGTEELIRRTPQFGPYLGEVPPPIPDVIHPEDIPQLRKDTQHSSVAATFPDPPPIHSTQLHIAANFYQSNDERTPDSSETDEVTVPLTEPKLNKAKKSSQKKATSSRFDSEEIMSTVDDRWPFPTTLDGVKVTDVPSDATLSASQGSTQQQSTTKNDIGTSTTTEKVKRTRERRSPHHEPGHVGETHEHHDHEMHKEQQSATAQACSLVTMSSSIMIIILSTVVYLW